MARVIGIDVSNMRLDVYSLEDGRRWAVDNDAAGIAALVDQLGLSAQDLLVKEASGGYERLSHRLFSAAASGSRLSTRRGCATLPERADAWPRLSASMPK